MSQQRPPISLTDALELAAKRIAARDAVIAAALAWSRCRDNTRAEQTRRRVDLEAACAALEALG